MKANELMIGDWVDFGSFMRQVIQPDYYQDVNGDCVLDGTQPIPLTTEILEKNGFVNSGGLWHLSGEDMGLMQGCISFQAFAYYADPRYCFCEIAYLHELQHALRLCGIDKEIVL